MNFIKSIHDCFLHRHISKPTRCRGADEPSTIDLIFIEEENQISNLTYLPPLGKNDHAGLLFEFVCEFDELKRKYLYHKADYKLMIADLQESNWKDIFLQIKSWRVCIYGTSSKQKIHRLRERFVPASSNEAPLWKIKGGVPVSSEVRNLFVKKGTPTMSLGKKQQRT